MTEQRLPDLPVANEVHVLFEVQQVRADTLEGLRDPSAQRGREHVADGRLRQILQASRLGALDELMEIQWQIRLLEMLVVQVRVRCPAQSLDLAGEELAVWSGLRSTADLRNDRS